MLAVICAFVLCVNGLSLQCNFIMTTDHYSCFRAALNNDGNSTHIQNVTGNHLKPNNNADVKGFYSNSDQLQLSRLPQGFELFFPNLVAFRWMRGNLTSITSDDLMPFPNLQYIGLSENKLSSLDGDLFARTPKLGYINFQNNQLQSVGYGLLDDLSKLIYAYFNGNPCKKLESYMTTLAGIQALIIDLRDQCPSSELAPTNTSPLSTTFATTPTKTSTIVRITTTPTSPTTVSTTIDSGHCSIGCLELIETLRKEVLTQKGEITTEITGLLGQVSIQSKAIVELEKLIRED